jgi:hypothetical protein
MTENNSLPKGFEISVLDFEHLDFEFISGFGFRI